MKLKLLANNHNWHVGNFLGSLRVAQQKKKTCFSYWPASHFVVSVAKALRDEGYVRGFTCEPLKESFKITVILKYDPITQRPLISYLRTYASPSRQYNLTYKDLARKTRSSSRLAKGLHFLSTTHGILTSDQCLSRAIGGNLLFKVR